VALTRFSESGSFQLLERSVSFLGPFLFLDRFFFWAVSLPDRFLFGSARVVLVPRNGVANLCADRRVVRDARVPSKVLVVSA